MKKRFVAIVLCLLMALSLLPAAALAETRVIDNIDVMYDAPRQGSKLSQPDYSYGDLMLKDFYWWSDINGDGVYNPDVDGEHATVYDKDCEYYLHVVFQTSEYSAFAKAAEGDSFVYTGKIVCNGSIEFDGKAYVSADGRVLTADIPVGVPAPAHDFGKYNVVWSEGFEAAGLPEGWSLKDADGDDNCWSVSYGTTNYDTHCGDGSVSSYSYIDSEPVNPDDWLITPETKVGKDYIFSFCAKAKDPQCSKEVFGVYISVDGGDFTQLGSDYTTSPQWTEYRFDLSAYEGKAVKLAIVHHKISDMFAITVDCVNMLQKAPYPFIDVEYEGRHAPYADAILWAADNGITAGYGNGIFKPDQGCTRAQVVTFLWRVAGCPAPKSSINNFSDVSSEGALAPYYTAILWASEQGITTGFNDGTFRPFAVCTRAQFVTFLWRYEGKTQVSIENPFTDVPHNAYYDAIMWAYETGVTKGYGGGLFKPDKDCSRAEVVTFIYRAEV